MGRDPGALRLVWAQGGACRGLWRRRPERGLGRQHLEAVGCGDRGHVEQDRPPVRWPQPQPGVPRPALTVGRELKGWELGRGQRGASGRHGGLAGRLASRGCQGFTRGPGGGGGGIRVTGSFLPLPALVSASASAFPSLPQSSPASPYLPLAFSFSVSL